MSTTEPEYIYRKGVGWVPRLITNLTWGELRTGDRVLVIDNGKERIARVHKAEEPLTLQPDDNGAWLYPLDNEVGPYVVHCFMAIKQYPGDRAWTQLVGISFPEGKDYV